MLLAVAREAAGLEVMLSRKRLGWERGGAGNPRVEERTINIDQGLGVEQARLAPCMLIARTLTDQLFLL